MYSLSIIVLNYNTYHLTCNCLQSIYDSNLRDIDLEVIVIDNGSTEACPTPLKSIFKNIIYIRNEHNVGFAKGNNIGLGLASKSYVLLLNSDTVIVDSETFQKTISVLKRYNNRVVLTTKLLTADLKPQVAYGPIPSLRHELIQTTFAYKFLSRERSADLLLTFVSDESRLIHCGYITATYFLFAKELLTVLPNGILSERTFMYGEELFWATSWQQRGISMYYYADVSIIHLIGQSSKSSTNYTSRMRREYQLRSEKQFLVWRYTALTIFAIYLLRLIRFTIISPFNKDIRIRLILLAQLILESIFGIKKK